MLRRSHPARRIWCRLVQGRSGTLRNTGWRHYIDPAGSATLMPGYLEAYVDRLAAAAERLHAVSLECLPVLDVIGKYGAQPEVLLYVDPPYLGTAPPRRQPARPVRTLPDLSTWTGTPAGQLTLWRNP